MRYATDLIGRFFEPQRGSDDNRLCRDFEEAKCTRDNVPLSFFLIYSPTMKLIDGTLNSDILLSNIICFKTELLAKRGPALIYAGDISTVTQFNCFNCSRNSWIKKTIRIVIVSRRAL